MKIKLGLGNAVTCAFNASAKTLTFTGAYNFSINETSIAVWNTTRSAWMLGEASLATGTTAVTLSAGLPVYTITLSDVPASSANSDTLVITMDCPDDVALYNATVATI